MISPMEQEARFRSPPPTPLAATGSRLTLYTSSKEAGTGFQRSHIDFWGSSRLRERNLVRRYTGPKSRFCLAKLDGYSWNACRCSASD